MNFTDPVAAEAEHRVIAICCEFPDRIDLVAAEPEDFFDLRWRKSWEALQDLHREHGDKLDSLMVMDQLRSRVANVDYAELINCDADPVLIQRYADIVREQASQRRLKLGLGSVVSRIGSELNADEASSEASRVLREALVGQPDDSSTVREVLAKEILSIADKLERMKNGEVGATGIPTGIAKLDAVLGGWQYGIVTLIAGRPGMGKSALALNAAEEAAGQGVGTHVFTLEDTKRVYGQRLLAMHSGVGTEKLRDLTGFTRGDLQAIQRAAEKIGKMERWLIDDRTNISAEEIVRCVRRKANENNTKLVIVDYITLLKKARGQNNREMIEDAMRTFAAAAKRDEMAYLVLAQLNRDCEKRDDKRPLQSDLKECGTLEEASKAIVMVYRPFVYEEKFVHGQYKGQEVPGQRAGERIPASVIEILIRKNSNGRTGPVLAKWIPERMTIE